MIRELLESARMRLFRYSKAKNQQDVEPPILQKSGITVFREKMAEFQGMAKDFVSGKSHQLSPFHREIFPRHDGNFSCSVMPNRANFFAMASDGFFRSHNLFQSFEQAAMDFNMPMICKHQKRISNGEATTCTYADVSDGNTIIMTLTTSFSPNLSTAQIRAQRFVCGEKISQGEINDLYDVSGATEQFKDFISNDPKFRYLTNFIANPEKKRVCAACGGLIRHKD